MITVVGLGIQRGDITNSGRKALKSGGRVFSRVKLWVKTENLGEKFSFAADYAELDRLIASEVIAADRSDGVAVYVTLGDGFTDTAVALMSEQAEVRFVAGVSEYRGRGADSSVAYMSAYDFDSDTLIDTSKSLVVYGIDDRVVAGAVKPILSDFYGEETEAVFSNGKTSETIKIYELDRQKSYKAAALYIRGVSDFTAKPRYCFNDLIAVMNALTAENGCPWDKAQTHESIRINLLEEAYEAADAIDKGDLDNLREELGDVLLQAVFHCNIAERTGEFTFSDVVNELVEKLVTRHTHIFGANKASDPDSALKFWEQAKAKEKKYDTLSEQLDRLPDGFPSLLKAAKAYKKSVKSGAGITAEIVKDKLNGLLEKGVDKDNAGDLLLYADFLATAAGADGEAELNKRAGKFMDDMKECESNKTLDRAAEKL